MSNRSGAALAAVVIAVLAGAAFYFAVLADPAEPGTVIVEAPATDDAAPSTGLRGREGDAVRATIREYLLENPEVLVEAMEVLQSRQAEADNARASEALIARADALARDVRDPSIGNPDASVTLVEFFDYQCPYCKQMAEDLTRLVEEDKDLRIVFKEFPVFGEGSERAARAALAAKRQDKYMEFHLALMELPGEASQGTIIRIAERLGLDFEQLLQDMEAPEIADMLRDNYELAREIGVRGTPAFIVGDELIPGAMNPQALRAFVERKRDES